MQVISKSCGLLQANMYIVYDEHQNAIVIDPISLPVLRDVLDQNSLSLRAIFLTHAHFDHVSDLVPIQELYSVPSYIHMSEMNALQDPNQNASYLIGKPMSFGQCTSMLVHGDIFTFGEMIIKVHHTPGHSLGSVCYEIDQALFSGDTLFAGGIGRSDLFGGDPAVLMNSLRSIAELDKNFTVYPGHGPSTTLLYEKSFNPYLCF